jgi:hypothetical protein
LLYPSLLAPGWLIGLEGPSMITWARLVNAALGAALVPLLYLLVLRLIDTTRSMALLGALTAASLPAAMLHASIVWTESLLPVVVAAGLLALDRFRRAPTAASATAVVALAIAQVATHPRAVPAALVLTAAVVWVSLRRGLLVMAMLTVAELAVGLGLLEWLRRTVHQAAFGSTGLYDAGDLADNRSWSDLPHMALLGAGTVAYLMLATAALAVVGGVVLWRTGLVGRTSLAMIGATVAMAGWFLIGVPRADKWLHGRYVEAVAAPVVAVGVARLACVDRRWIAGLGGSIVAAGLLTAWSGPGDNWWRPRSPVMMLGVEPAGAPFGTDRFEPGAAASVALVVLVGWWLVARHRPRWLAVAVAPVLVVASLSGLRTLDELYLPSAGAQADAAIDSAHLDTDEMRVAIDPAVSASAWIAVGWSAGFDATLVGPPDADTTLLLLPAGTAGPVGATEVAAVADAVLYRLPSER